jgi:uncharacterized protein (DUF433 family)
MATMTERYCFEGMYEPSEAARYIAYTLNQTTPFKIESKKIIRWMKSGLSTEGLKDLPGRKMLLSFEDFISMRIITALRQAGVSFQKIHKAEDWLRETTGHPRPFATEMLWTERSDVFVQLKKQLLAASRNGQYALQILEQYVVPVSGLTFDEKSGNVVEWKPSNGIVFNPKIHFGTPCLVGTRIPTTAIWAMVQGGDDPSFVASSYEIPLDEVYKAIEWEQGAHRN